MRKPKRFVFCFALCLGLAAAEVVTLNHSKFLRNPNAGPGPVRSAISNSTGILLVSEPVTLGMPWILHSPHGQSTLNFPASTLVALGDSYVVWNQPTPLNTTIRSCSLPRCESVSSIVADIRGIFALKSIGSSIFAMHHEATGTYLSQVDLPSGRVAKLESLSGDRQLFRFGSSTPTRIVIVDPAAFRFRVVIPGNPAASSAWIEMRSDLIDAIKNKKPDFQAFGGAKVVSAGIFTHWVSPSGRDVFLLAKGEKGSGQYAIEVDREGREQARYLLSWPEGKSANLGFPDFDRTFTSSEGVHLYSRTGVELVYGGVK